MIYYRYTLEEKPGHKNSGNGPAIKNIEDMPLLTEFDRKYDDDQLSALNDYFMSEYQANNDYLICITNRCYDTIVLLVAANAGHVNLGDIECKIRSVFKDCSIKEHSEIMTDDFKKEIKDNRWLMSMLKLDYCSTFSDDDLPFDTNEIMYSSVKMSKSDCSRRAKQILASRSLNEELDRIYSKDNAKQYYGHPVHYLISANNWDAAMDIKDLLVSALYSNGRLLSGRQTLVRNFKFNNIYNDIDCFKQHMKACEGGIVVMELNDRNDSAGPFACPFHEIIKLTGEILGEQKKDTLFIFIELLGNSVRNGEAINDLTGKADIIRITEGTGNLQQAKKYLAELVDKTEFEFAKSDEIFDYLPEQDRYTVSEIYAAYNAWHENNLKTYVYKAYKTQKTYKVKADDFTSTPYEALHKLVGLDGIKTVIDQIIAAGKVKRARERMGLNTEFSSMHMLFTGTPGTAKTTVARMVTGILKEEDIITTGQFVECGRQDIIGRYVGWTAKAVEEKFQAAAGGVLFIDEAYSLIDGYDGYGAEAINTITQLMENYRDSVIVIFAGYPDKMRDFLSQNEGLRSRIAFHLDFPDYSPDELTDILKLMCEARQYTISDDALACCKSIFEHASRVENFGNGRYVRNVLEQAIMRQSNRIIAESAKTGAELTKDKLCLLEACDFKFVPLGGTATNKIGFSI
ncbi:MAG: AAA family ATPase [Saccharofermentans sp.]|nr:AAA family ATPase [Saccharofermentans sp.]